MSKTIKKIINHRIWKEKIYGVIISIKIILEKLIMLGVILVTIILTIINIII